ncbi:MAG TPA: phage tail protein [Saprospiraceae bacterium]|nr:phage tail protein [Saprospiraceae bacterium]
MAREGGYPLPKFHYQVNYFGFEFGFTEVSGLDFETEVIEYREGNAPLYHKTKQPGLTKYSNITLKRGMFKGDNKEFDHWKKTFYFQEGKAEFRGDCTISMLDEEHNPVFVWKAVKAWPSKVQSTDLKADGNEVAIETMELVHEGLSLEAK